MANQTYKTIPVDTQTHERLGKIARALGFGERGLGAVVRRLVKQEYAKLLAGQLIADELPEPAREKPV